MPIRSILKEVVTELPDDFAMKSQSVAPMLIKKGVKPEELEYANLALPKGKVTKQDLIDCMINRYFFVSPQYQNLLGRQRYKYVINGLTFLNMLFNLLEFLQKKIVEQNLELNKLVKIINKCAKTFSVDLKQMPKELKQMKILESYDYLLDNITNDYKDYKKLGKKDVNDILNMLNKNN